MSPADGRSAMQNNHSSAPGAPLSRPVVGAVPEIQLVEQMSKLTNVLITGGAGYVGHVLTPRLLSLGYKVTVIDKLWYGARLPNSPDLKVIQGDIRDQAAMAEALKGQD